MPEEKEAVSTVLGDLHGGHTTEVRLIGGADAKTRARGYGGGIGGGGGGCGEGGRGIVVVVIGRGGSGGVAWREGLS